MDWNWTSPLIRTVILCSKAPCHTGGFLQPRAFSRQAIPCPQQSPALWGGRWLGATTKGGGEGTFASESGIGKGGRAGVRRGAMRASLSLTTGQTCVRAAPPPQAGAGDSCSPVQRPWSHQKVQECRGQAGMTAVGSAAVG